MLHTPIQILNVKKYQKNLKFGDIKPGFPIYFLVKFHEKNPENVFVAKKILSEHSFTFQISRCFFKLNVHIEG